MGWVFGNYWFVFVVVRDPIFIISIFGHLFGSHTEKEQVLAIL